MTVEEFVNEYVDIEEGKEKEFFLEHIDTTLYVPYRSKLNLCTQIVNLTTHTETDEETLFWMNTPARALMFKIKLIETYTDIELDYTADILEIYDQLERFDLIDTILSYIDQKELQRFSDILTYVGEDVYENERGIVSFAERIMTSVNNTWNGFPDALVKVETNE